MVELDYFFEPDPIGIELVEGKSMSFDFKVTLSCVYLTRIGFYAENGGHDSVRKTFLKEHSIINLPASIDFVILNSDKEVIF